MKEITDQQYIDAARRLYQCREKYAPDDGDIEIDDEIGDPNHMVSRGGPDGAYVRAWVWVYADQVKSKSK